MPRQGKAGKTPCSAMQKFTPRYGCWFWWGSPPPWLGWTMFGARLVLRGAATKFFDAVDVARNESPPLLTGEFEPLP